MGGTEYPVDRVLRNLSGFVMPDMCRSTRLTGYSGNAGNTDQLDFEMASRARSTIEANGPSTI